MSDLVVLAMTSITIGLIILALGLSLISKSLDSLSYDSKWQDGYTAKDYYNNPLRRLKSKWFYYRPRGSVIISKKQWDDIEKNIAIRITDAKRMGKLLGRKELISEISDSIAEKKATIFPTSPYAILNVSSTMPAEEIKLKYQHMMKIYDPKNFVDLDKAFMELAEIRQNQLKRAWKQINYGIGRSKGDI